MIDSIVIEKLFDKFSFSLDMKEKFNESWAQVTNSTADSIRNNTQNLTCLKCCLFIVETKSQRPIDKNRMGMYLSISPEDTSDSTNTEDFISILKLILPEFNGDGSYSTIADIINDFSFTNQIFRKFEEGFNLFFDAHSHYFLTLKKLLWSFYICIRTKLYGHSRNLLLCYPVLLSVFSIVFDSVDKKMFARSISSTTENIFDILCNNFRYKMEYSKLIEMKGMIAREMKKDEEMSKHSHQIDLSTEVSMKEITHTLNSKYETYLKLFHFDERILLSVKNSSDSSPMKLTPFKRQKTFSNFDSTMKLPAFKTLLFEKDPKALTNLSGSSSMNLSGSIKRPHPYMEAMTPCSRVVYMDKWVKDYISDWKPEKLTALLNSQNEDNSPVALISKLMDKFASLFETYKIRLETPTTYFKSLAEKMTYKLILREDGKFNKEFTRLLLQNQRFLKSALVVAVEFILFIENVEEISFYKLAEIIDLDLYDLWKIINPFLLFDPYIPKPIRLHFCEIEFQLLSFLIWKKPSAKFKKEVDEFFNQVDVVHTNEISTEEIREVENIEFNNQSLFVFHDSEVFYDEELTTPCITAESTGNSVFNSINLKSYRYIKPIYIFLRRILNYSNLLNKKICDNLTVPKEMTKESEMIIKRILTTKSYITLLFDRHIDQIIICAILCVFKLRDMFKESDYKRIMDCYHLCKPEETDQSMNALFSKIKTTSNTFGSLIEFYNNVFTKKVNDLIVELKNEDEEISRVVKRRKMSMPDDFLCKNKLSSESAFDDKGISYEPIKNAMFNNKSNCNIPLVRNYFLNSRNVEGSPMVSRTSYLSSNLNRTPRNKKMKDSYSDLCFESEKASSQSSLTKLQTSNAKSENPFAGRLNIINPKLAKTSLNFDSTSNNFSPFLNETSKNFNFSFSNSQEMNDPTPSPRFFSRSQSQSTPEFDKTKK